MNMRIAHKIIRVPILPWGMVNAYLIVNEEHKCILVDTGLPESEARIEKALKKHGLTFKDIRLIVVTHAHVDHAGNAAVLRELSGAPIAAHKGDIEHFSRKRPMTFCPTGWVGRLFLKTPLPHAPYKAFSPDILLSDGDELDLGGYGHIGSVRPTLGHTAGSISVELPTNEALVGDLVASGILLGGLIRTGHAKRPPFEDAPHAVGAALQRLVDSGIEKFYMGHGGPLPAHEVLRHAGTLLAI